MKKKTSKSEDDTFEILRRIPFDEVYKHQEILTTIMWKNEKSKRWINNYENKWYRRLFLKLNMFSFIPSLNEITLKIIKDQISNADLIVERDEFMLKDFGWTAKKYIEEIQKRMAEAELIERKRKFKLLIYLFIILSLGPIIMFGLGLLSTTKFFIISSIGLIIFITWGGMKIMNIGIDKKWMNTTSGR